jgi:hypothetical protein
VRTDLSAAGAGVAMGVSGVAREAGEEALDGHPCADAGSWMRSRILKASDVPSQWVADARTASATSESPLARGELGQALLECPA